MINEFYFVNLLTKIPILLIDLDFLIQTYPTVVFCSLLNIN